MDADEAKAVQELPTLADDVVFIRHFVLLTAQSEMLHLRWVNELLWELFDNKLITSYEPVLKPALEVPADTDSGFRPRSLDPLTPNAIDGYVFIEDPGGYIDSAYGRVVATLRLPQYPPHLVDLAVRVATDGVEHFSRFKDIRKIVRTYRTYQEADDLNPYLRSVRVGNSEETGEALDLYKQIIGYLKEGYSNEAKGQPIKSGRPISEARAAMLQLYKVGDELARKGIGIPFFETK